MQANSKYEISKIYVLCKCKVLAIWICRLEIINSSRTPKWSWRCISWKNLSKVYKGCWWCSTLKAVVAISKLILWRTGCPVQVGQNWRDVAVTVPRLLCNNSSKGILNHLKASKIWCGHTCKKRITIVEPRADYCHGYCFCCFSGQRWTNLRRARRWMYDELQISETCLSKDIWESR